MDSPVDFPLNQSIQYINIINFGVFPNNVGTPQLTWC